MITVGVDVAKTSVVAVVIDRSTKIKASYTIENTKEALETFVASMQQRYKKVMFASEATAEYHRTLALTCLAHTIPFRLLNPIVTKQFTRSTIRKRKTDVSDALTIAKLAFTGEGVMVTEKSFAITKSYTRTAAKLVAVENKLKLMQQRLKVLTPEDTELLKSLEGCINQLKQSVVVFRSKARGRVDTTQAALLQSIPGIGETIASILLAEIGDVHQFTSSKSLVAFAGIDPKVKQSGKGLKQNTHLTKRGSPYLRQALFQAASVARQHDEELKRYYEKKRSEGKRYKEATIAVARKLLNRVYAVFKRQTAYAYMKVTK